MLRGKAEQVNKILELNMRLRNENASQGVMRKQGSCVAPTICMRATRMHFSRFWDTFRNCPLSAAVVVQGPF